MLRLTYFHDGQIIQTYAGDVNTLIDKSVPHGTVILQEYSEAKIKNWYQFLRFDSNESNFLILKEEDIPNWVLLLQLINQG